MKKLIYILTIFSNGLLMGQMSITFESVKLDTTGYLNGSDQKGGFTIDNVFFPNHYNPQWKSWTGWAITSVVDTTTRGFTNQYASIPGSGALKSKNYAISFISGETKLRLNNKQSNIKGLYVTNATYTYFSMKEGDAFAKKFGGVTGKDPDFLKLNIGKWQNGQKSPILKEVYLADFRSPNDSEDFILKDWLFTDLSNIGQADSLYFTMQSSDVGAFGINTPTYFCIDELSFDAITATTISELSHELKAYPTITNDVIRFAYPEKISLIDIHGRTILQTGVKESQISIAHLKTGWYILLNDEGKMTRIYKQDF